MAAMDYLTAILDIYIVADEEGRQYAMKLHRYMIQPIDAYLIFLLLINVYIALKFSIL